MSNNAYLKNTGGSITKSMFNRQDRIVPGYYTSDTVDMYGHVINPEGMLEAIVDYRQWGTVREMHSTPIGVAASIGIPEWNFISAKISSTPYGDQVLQLVQDGVYGAFSVGIIVTKAEWTPVNNIPADSFRYLPNNIKQVVFDMGEVLSIREMTLLEVSIVDRPANPAARMQEFAKSLTGANAIGSLPAVYEPNSKSILAGGVLVNPQSTMLITEGIKNAMGDNNKNRGDMRIMENEKSMQDTQDEVVNAKDEQIPVVEAEDVVNQEITEKSVDASDESKADENQLIDDKQNDDERTIDVELANKLVSIEADIEFVRKSVVDLAGAIESVTETVNKLMASIEKNLQEQTVADKGEEETLDIEKLIEGAVNKAVESVVEKLPVTGHTRKSSVAPVGQDESVAQEVNIKELDARSLSRILAQSVASRAANGG